MSAPYLLAAWPTASEAARRRVSALQAALEGAGWRSGLARPGLQVWVRAARPLPITWCEDLDGLVLGRCFQRGGAVAPPAGGSAAAVAAWMSHSRWGAYVAVLRNQNGDLWAFRDPGGALEAFTWARDEIRLLAADVDCAPPDFWPSDIALDWKVIAHQVAAPEALDMRSALRGVHPVLPGDLQRLGEAEARAIWRPSAYLPAAHDAPPDAAGLLTETVCSAVQSLVEGYDRVISEASGGLDSSIVNAALSARGLGGKVATALHYAGDRRESYEQQWAAAVAGRWGLPLEVVQREVSVIDPQRDFEAWAAGVRPPVGVLDTWRDQDTARRMAAVGAQALLTGMGGDAVFFQMPTALVLSDLWRAQGLHAARHPAPPQVARWLRRSIWSVGGEALRRARSARRARGGATAAPAHPWLEDMAGAPPGKRLQVQGLVGVQRAYGRSRRSAVGDVVHPLMAQPVVELCLATPSWVLVRGGRDRGLAREAFAGLLPDPVLTRSSKGGLTSLFSRRVAASLNLLRPYLLEGVLADAGLLDREVVGEALTPDRLIWRADGVSLVMVAALEAWVRHWQTRIPDSLTAPRPRLAR